MHIAHFRVSSKIVVSSAASFPLSSVLLKKKVYHYFAEFSTLTVSCSPADTDLVLQFEYEKLAVHVKTETLDAVNLHLM